MKINGRKEPSPAEIEVGLGRRQKNPADEGAAIEYSKGVGDDGQPSYLQVLLSHRTAHSKAASGGHDKGCIHGYRGRTYFR
jgi:hypothetical protein